MELPRDLIMLARSRGQSVGFLSLDIAKAFDSLSREYLFSILGEWGFGEAVVRLVKSLYTSSVGQVNINGRLSRPFEISRVVRYPRCLCWPWTL